MEPKSDARGTHAIRVTCPQEGATHFSGHTLIIYMYIYPRARESQFQCSLVYHTNFGIANFLNSQTENNLI